MKIRENFLSQTALTLSVRYPLAMLKILRIQNLFCSNKHLTTMT